MGWIINKFRTLLWTTFYYMMSPIVFEKIGKGCRFQGWIDIPERCGKIGIGNNVLICRRVTLTVTRLGRLSLDDNVFIGPGAVISAHGFVSIGRDALIGEYVCVHDNDHTTSDLSRPISCQGFEVGTCVIGEGAWVGAGAKLLRGTNLGAGSIVGAGAVVNRAFDSKVVIGGVPAKILKRRSMNTTS
jgi:acetyltransferase-like isoleucine patch superfamily enzyme